MIGKTISHYKILAKLGEGGMGVVYKAEDTRLKRIVALKFLPSSIMASEAEKTRFVHEAQAAAALNHPNICTIYEIDEVDGQSFIAMEFVEGQSLKEKVASGMLQMASVIDLAIQIAEGLQAAHEKKITHRDIKPANIMLTPKGQVKIMDFGLAKLAGRTAITKEGMTLGTVAYMSPEQARGEEVDHRTDIWAFGVVLYEMITGQHPFKGLYEQAVMYSIMNEEPEPMIPTGSGRTGVPMELERIVKKALAKKTNLRYQNITDLLVDLNALEMQVKSGVPSKPSLKGKPSVRKPLRLYGGVAALAILAVAAALFFRPKAQPQETFTSIAVLPFTDMSSQKDQEYFCDGMTEEILTKLSKLRELKVIARTSVMRYKNTDKSIKEIGEELNVATVLEGSIRKEDNNVRVTVQLIKVEDESHLWAQSYNKRLASVFDLQDEVSHAIAQALQVTMTAAKISALASAPPKNAKAYEYYLKGRYLLFNKFVPSGQESDLQNALNMFQQAIAIDSNYALAYAGLADAFHLQWVFSGFGSQEALDQKFKNAAMAVKLDPNSAEAHTMMASAYMSRLDYEKAYQSLKLALRLNANLADANYTAGFLMRNLGLLHQGVKYFYRTIELDPFSLRVYGLCAERLIELGELGEAAVQLRRAAEIDPNHPSYYLGQASLGILMRNYEQADTLLKKAEKIAPKVAVWHRALFFAAKGEKEKALALSQEPEVYALLGMRDEAVRNLKKRTGFGGSHYLYLIHYPVFADLRAVPEFIELVEQEKKKYEENLQKYGDLSVLDEK
jgi:non-specific serine/threonine protein kinase